MTILPIILPMILFAAVAMISLGSLALTLRQYAAAALAVGEQLQRSRRPGPFDFASGMRKARVWLPAAYRQHFAGRRLTRAAAQVGMCRAKVAAVSYGPCFLRG